MTMVKIQFHFMPKMIIGHVWKCRLLKMTTIPAPSPSFLMILIVQNPELGRVNSADYLISPSGRMMGIMFWKMMKISFWKQVLHLPYLIPLSPWPTHLKAFFPLLVLSPAEPPFILEKPGVSEIWIHYHLPRRFGYCKGSVIRQQCYRRPRNSGGWRFYLRRNR